MAWIYSQESEDSRWPSVHGSGQSPIVRTIHTHRPYCSQGWPIDNCHKLQYGTMCERCERNTLEFQLTSSTEASHARTSVQQAVASAWRESEVDWLTSSSVSSENSSQLSFSWRTWRTSECVARKRWGKSWPAEGTIVGGRCYQRPNSAFRTAASVGSSLLPTPTASDCKRGKNSTRMHAGKRSGDTLPGLAYNGLLPGHPAGKYNPEWTEQAMGFPAGWTELKEWAMRWCRSKRKKPSRD